MSQRPSYSDEITPFRNQDIVILGAFGLIALLILCVLTRAPLAIAGLAFAAYGFCVFLYWTYRQKQTREVATTDYFTQGDIYQFGADLIDILPQAMAIVDKNNDILHANAAARDLMKIETLGLPLSAYVSHPEINMRLSRALAGYEPEALMLHIEEPRDQYIRLLFSRAHSFHAADGHNLTFVIFDDVTDDNVEQQRRADFLANASHELKTPIASLMGYVETLRGHAKEDPEARERFLDIMHSQAERMQRLISDLLSLRRIELTQNEKPSETADLHLAIATAIEAVDPLCEQRDIDVIYRAVGRGKALINGKQDECIQLCLNLIENAVKISPPGSEVTVKLRRLQQWSPMRAYDDASLSDEAASRRIVNAAPSPLPGWLITVSDEGPGLAREHIPRIGERFYRVAGDLSSKEKGTGLGLAIVKHIVRRHRGGFYLRSAAGQGTDFSVLMMEQEKPDTAEISA